MFIPKSMSHVSLHEEEVFLSSDPPIMFNLGDLCLGCGDSMIDELELGDHKI